MKKLLGLMSIVFFVACGGDDNTDNPILCTLDLRAGIEVTVRDGLNGNFLTEGVTVVIVDNEYTETLKNGEGSNSFFGAYERAGTYIITASKAGYDDTSKAEPIIVKEDVCHVITEKVEIILRKNQ
ncbi:hypothetical protein [Aquimarina sp. AU474]|uniref:hypothetical protein n=1 Tax=Aquimarina sp. AU474 TaxID=2108529 RepID=UPI000D69B740|nr:hypothetical protein [Aquimarina sp. AU474]